MSLPKILVINSVDPTVGPGEVALNFYKVFLHNGFEVDLLTKYPVVGYTEFISVYKRKPNFIQKRLDRLINNLSGRSIKYIPGSPFFYKKEDKPPVPVKDVIRKITKSYDVVYVVFWQGMLSFMTIEAIYQKLHCQIQFHCVDYSPMAGGCHFTGTCQRYKTDCGNCPAIYSKNPNDFTNYNVKYRQRIYEEVSPIVYGNNYMQNFYNKSFLLKNYSRKESVYPLVDNKMFHPYSLGELCSLRHKYGYNDEDFILFFGSQSLIDERKGILYLIKTLQILHQKLSDKEIDRVKLIIAGKDVEPIKKQLCFAYNYIGYVQTEKLVEIYNISNAFICSSVNDAGPTMVNQSLSCGTPVVAFEMGTAIDMVKDQNTGYCAILKDSKDLANGIDHIMHLSKEKYDEMSKKCRKVAIALTSEKAFVDKFLEIYYKYKKKDEA
jgi:glycosyltransferase involved in cell wall biosynthesis